MVKIGIIGTGMLGEAVCLHLLNSGYSVSVYNRTKSKTKNLEEKGADVAELPSVVAESSDLIITCVKDADAVKQVLFGQGGVVSGKHDDMTVADMSTINPNAAKEISKNFMTRE
uniref:2-hydroxy-3-oxopropionate reductase (MmsB) n=1 Tax=uncultured marine thaumarchaeote SAT1000_09_A04 TaxID=1456366 RepID=A0A075I2X7_9ARCH|nr:2-hydroxy-3-oxopropionate reductase (mmsB) [uncultured marine thaumarchaeote SAT1000_09_A04]